MSSRPQQQQQPHGNGDRAGQDYMSSAGGHTAVGNGADNYGE
jgi:hypothetical protein